MEIAGEDASNLEGVVFEMTILGDVEVLGATWATGGVNSGTEVSTQAGVMAKQLVLAMFISSGSFRMGMVGLATPMG